MATEPHFVAPLKEHPEPTSVTPPASVPRRPGLWASIAIAAVVGALAGSGATIITAHQLSQGTSPASNPVVPLAPITNRLTEESSVITVAEKAGPAVVEIATKVVTPDLFVQREQSGIGSGFIVRSDGYIVTNNHVVANATQLKVIVRDQNSRNKAYDATIVGSSPDDDIAVLRINATCLPTLSFGDSTNLKVGQLAIAIGSPLGQQNSVTKGVISALHRSLQVPDPTNPGDVQTILNAIQTDASINPGNSGGPLLNSAGEVIGVNFAVEQGRGGPGIGFALDGNATRDIADQLIKTGRINRPFLGLSYESIDETRAAASSLPVGALVRQVERGSPADAAGIRARDVITQVNDQSIDDNHPLKDVLRRYRPGDQVTMTVQRGSQTLKLKVTLSAGRSS